ncbi:plasmid replication, integration and excision activator [Nocardioides sp. NPDC087217]|uniref:plasmid replication, integration and excision activator n=1 Tax=Nocardioides sp. NPDC087217 TaxID=3364335 RepID=UPI00382FC252
MSVKFEGPFPNGAYVVGEVTPVLDFNAGKRPDGSMPQKIDEESGLPVWTVPVLDADPDARKNEKTVNVKILAKHQPVPPANETGLPFVPVEFVGLTAAPWIDTNGPRPRLQWSLMATEMIAPSAAAPAGASKTGTSSTSSKAA